ncbi:MAG: hypothetical protein KIS66_17820 [Fimbriimonadaceae bacterium]|nr:hypothetical protein [Fimbriimonadaceae bacterium]
MKRALLFLGLLPALLQSQSLLSNLQPRQLGPTVMGGRIADIAPFDKDPRIFYVATASGGLWKSSNGGITMAPVWDRGSSVALGAVAVGSEDPNLVWIGTGEANSRNSTAWGDGVYKSTDGGKTWESVGLRNSKHVSSILIHPKDPNTVFVGALGPLWGTGDERGLYRTTDGGKTWERTLYVDDRTGVIDLVMDPKNPRNMLCAMYERMRKPWQFASGGPGSGLYRSTDGGKSWKKVEKGIPAGPLGRIGLDYFDKDPKIVIATIEAGQGGGGFFRSTDGGETWTKMGNTNPRPFYFSIPRQDPLDENRVYVPGVQLMVSDDKGATFRRLETDVHVDHHAMWINPTDGNHMMIGEDGGLAQTRDRGEKWEHINSMPIGQFYAVAFDMRRPYYVYGGLQDNGSWGTPTQTAHGGVAFWHTFNVAGGDGFHVQVDPEDWRTVYAESQGGFLQRTDIVTGSSRLIRPRPPQGETYRFNWSAPVVISPHNAKTLWFGGNRLFKSVNRGDTWERTDDLTTNDPAKLNPRAGVTPEDTGAERHCTIITIGESPVKAGVVWVGTDDGNVQLSQDDGKTWENVVANIPDLPANSWCSRVTPSRYKLERCYVTFDNHRSNDYKSYVYVTEDFGKTWSKLNAGIPEGDCAYVIKEGLRNEDLLFLGTEMSLWVSLDRGTTWERFTGGFPTVAVHDVAIQPTEGELVIGTHGRSLWLMDVNGLDQLTAKAREEEVALFKPQDVLSLGFSGYSTGDGARVYLSRNTQPGTSLWYWLKADATEEPRLTITDVTGREVASLTGSKSKGLNRVAWNGRAGRTSAAPGTYKVTLRVGETEKTTTVTVVDVSASVHGG